MPPPDIHLVLGTAAYPEGHGRIEKFNQTAGSQILRGLPGAADVDADCGALELRLSHFFDHRESQQPHEALGACPKQRRRAVLIRGWSALTTAASQSLSVWSSGA